MHAQRPRADAVRAGALGASWPLRLRGAPAPLAARAAVAGPRAPKMHEGQSSKRPSSTPSSSSSSWSSPRAPQLCRALPADAAGAPLLEAAYTTDRTPDSEPKLVDAADVDSHRSLR
jgi:hypothetical protein